MLKELLKDIDKCIEELEDLKQTIQKDTERIQDKNYSRVSRYSRIDSSKQMITTVRRYIHRRLIRNERELSYMELQSEIRKIRDKKIKSIEEYKK